jgi:hypothetical protein
VDDDEVSQARGPAQARRRTGIVLALVLGAGLGVVLGLAVVAYALIHALRT